MDHESGIQGLACAEARLSLQAYVEERLEEPRRLEVRRHLLTCARCREAGAAIDPSIIFLSPDLAPRETDAAFWTRFDATLRSRLQAETQPRRGALSWILRAPRLAYAAPILAAALLGGLLFVNRGPAGPSTIPAVVAMQATGDVVEPDRHGLGRRLPTAAEEVASLPTLEEVSSPKARVYRLDVPVSAVAAGGDAGAVYFVVDESINF
jgi:anti-sigma factor RsiW